MKFNLKEDKLVLENIVCFPDVLCYPLTPLTCFYSGAESFRMPRQAEEEQGTLSKITDTIKSYYSDAVNTASGYLDDIKGLKLEEKAV